MAAPTPLTNANHESDLICGNVQAGERKGVKCIIDQQEKWFQFLPTPKTSVYTLLSLMPSVYQQENLEAMLGLFLQAQRYPLPEHIKVEIIFKLAK